MFETLNSKCNLIEFSSQVNAGYLDMVKAFEVYDKGNRGLLSREDFKRVLRHFTVDLTKSQIETLLQRFGPRHILQYISDFSRSFKFKFRFLI